MSKKTKRYDKIMAMKCKNDINFEEMHNFLLDRGFECKKSSGSSHRIYNHKKYDGIVNIQEVDGLVKKYQVKQVQSIIILIGGN